MSVEPIRTLLRRTLRLDPPAGMDMQLRDHAMRVVRGEIEPRHRPVPLRTVALSAAVLALVAAGSVKLVQERAFHSAGGPPGSATPPPPGASFTPQPVPSPSALPSASPLAQDCAGDNAATEPCAPVGLFALSPAGVGLAVDTIATEQGTTTASVLRSTSAGRAWSVVWRGAGVTDLQWIDSSHAVIASSTAVLESSDAGATWHVLFPRALVRLRFASPSVGLAVSVDHNLLRTSDGGHSFAPVATPLQAEAVDVLPDGHAWIAGPTGIAMSTDFGRTWSSQRVFASPYAVADWRVHLHFVDDQHGAVLYRSATTAMNQDGVGFYATSDGGRTWTAEFTDGFVPNPTGEHGAGSAPGFDVVPEFAVPSAGTVFMATIDPVKNPTRLFGCPSADSGAHWNCLTAMTGIDALPQDVAVVSSGGKDWMVSFGGGGSSPRTMHVLVSADGGATWSTPYSGTEPR